MAARAAGYNFTAISARRNQAGDPLASGDIPAPPEAAPIKGMKSLINKS